MIKPIIFAAAIMSIAGCGTFAMRTQTVPEVRIVEKKVPTPVRCIDTMPPPPTLEPIPDADITKQTLVRIRREAVLIEYSNKLKLLAVPCTENPK